MTTAAVGQQIRTLESFLGCQLFLRTGSGVQPTDSARRIEHKLSASFAAIDEIINELKHRPPDNRLAITLPSSFAENWFALRLPDFYRLDAEIDLRLDASNRMVNLLAEDFDFAIRYAPPSSESYDDRPLFGDFVLPVCTPEFAQRYHLSESCRSLDGVPLIHLAERTPDPQWADWTSWCEAFGLDQVSADPGMRLTEFNSGIQIAFSGQGLVLCGITEAYSAIQRGQLVAPFGPGRNCPTGYSYRLVSVAERRLSALQLRFRDWIIGAAQEFSDQIAAWLVGD